jgi:nucleoside-diphosphate-sugar epimerase
MKILVIGAAGMLGRKLVERLCKGGDALGQPISTIIRHDVVLAGPPPAASFPIETHLGDLSVAGEAEKLIAG